MKTINLYVTDWAPNGTNDLLICDENHTIVDYIEGATFGINVMKHRSPINDLVANDTEIFSIARTEEELPSEFTFVKNVNVADLKKFLAVSPVDPEGTRVIAELKKHGIELEGI